jgi:hypothetical protein
MAVKTVKFGGTSLCNAENFTKVKNIILADKARKYVVPPRRANASPAMRRLPTCCIFAMPKTPTGFRLTTRMSRSQSATSASKKSWG